jgi:uncharacterized protein (TIGR02246 family)
MANKASKLTFFALAQAVGMMLFASGSAVADPAEAEKTALTSVMSRYEAALNASDTEGALELYADDGVFMPPYSQSAIGKTAVRESYKHVFATITLHVKFTIREIVLMSTEWAFVRTNSAGTNKINATGAMSAEGNQELFIFRKISGVWKIERYSFSSTNPPPKP